MWKSYSHFSFVILADARLLKDKISRLKISLFLALRSQAKSGMRLLLAEEVKLLAVQKPPKFLSKVQKQTISVQKW